LHAELAVLAGQPDAAGQLEAAAPAGEENRWAAACLDRAWGRLTGDVTRLTESVRKWTAIDARFERACTLLLIPGREAEAREELTALGATPPAA
jgi:hypothetical protein